VVLLTNLVGAMPEQLSAVHADQIDLAFIDRIARYYAL